MQGKLEAMFWGKEKEESEKKEVKVKKAVAITPQKGNKRTTREKPVVKKKEKAKTGSRKKSTM